MKTAATGRVQFFEKATGAESVSSTIRIPAIIRSGKAKASVRVVIEADSYDLEYWIEEFQRIAEIRAKAHDLAAARLRRVGGPDAAA